jgi:hypothetical protein
VSAVFSRKVINLGIREVFIEDFWVSAVKKAVGFSVSVFSGYEVIFEQCASLFLSLEGVRSYED